ncbi:hypothetical protein COEREDRAFT_87722 [Coemansia reversa NRRL 1564]|uniref:Uncharacterized protein n=1 Tax=Coemansia reversa (strain ATCC 12441 / NRRL 1564) TaxID=763665 RepID=A0A2G5B965_COERN|nr:hypothetical protein COEREDRAFT_87722 [Coemansia reversa NRRL 1564]|eukprot:PIA15530.1 hypothetical protein COEREDRAFT_87722 [Coemansia reversa NRRL 1564]
MTPLYIRHASRAYERTMYAKHIDKIVSLFELFLNSKGVDDIDIRDVREALDKLTYRESITDAYGEFLELYKCNLRFVNNEDKSEVNLTLLACISETDIIINASDLSYIYSVKEPLTVHK